MNKSTEFRFRNRDSIGFSAAEDDKTTLERCFIDKGDLDSLRDCDDNRFLVIGRTGAGKTALLQQLELTEERVINIEPDKLALSYVSSSTILKNVMDLNVSLDPLFKLLWRHVFAVEFLHAHFGNQSTEGRMGWIDILLAKVRGKRYEQAVHYLRTWGEKFWLETDYRIKETTQKFEHELTASLKPDLKVIGGEMKSGDKVSEEQKSEVIQRFQQVVARVQIKELGQVIDLIDYILTDKQKKYYIVIDRLDDEWIEDKFRYALIRALIETARDFNNKVHNVKIIVALRVDLIERVYKLTGGSGFQPEKFQSLYLDIVWTKQRLMEVLDSRINNLVVSHYSSSKSVTHRDILPKSIQSSPAIEYILDRTFMRPRDLIMFFNKCIEQAIDNPRITEGMIKTAELAYSRSRLDALKYEWGADYPNLREFIDILKSVPAQFKLEDLSRQICEDFCLDMAVRDWAQKDFLVTSAIAVAHGDQPALAFRNTLIALFYKVGLVSLKLTSLEKPAWSYENNNPISSSDLDQNTKISIHPSAWRALGIVKSPKKGVNA